MTTDIRRNDDGSVDEIVSSDVAHFHLEQMDDGHWWMRLDLADGRAVVVQLHTRRGALIQCLAEMDG